MLPFELSAIDLILLIAVIILLILYITKPETKPSSIGEKIPSDKPVTSLKTEGEGLLSTQPQTDSPKCSHGFGYLKKLDKNAPIPDKCLNCPRIMECFGSNK